MEGNDHDGGVDGSGTIAEGRDGGGLGGKSAGLPTGSQLSELQSSRADYSPAGCGVAGVMQLELSHGMRTGGTTTAIEDGVCVPIHGGDGGGSSSSLNDGNGGPDGGRMLSVGNMSVSGGARTLSSRLGGVPHGAPAPPPLGGIPPGSPPSPLQRASASWTQMGSFARDLAGKVSLISL